jgi:hypothetical protein
MKKPEIFICECYSTQHQMVFYFDEDEFLGQTQPSVYVHVNLNKKSFRERLIHGIKYIFGYQCRLGAFDEFILNPDDAERMQEVVNYLKKCKIEKT